MEEQKYPCDNCGEHIKIDLKERKHPGAIIESYVQCPHCDEEFISYVTDPQARREQEEVRKLHERYVKKRGKLSLHMEKLKSGIINKREASE